MGDLKKSGYRAWWPMLQTTGRKILPDGRRAKVGQEVLLNMLTGEIVSTEKGWNAEPPNPTGEKDAQTRHMAYGNDELWTNLAAHKDETHGTVVESDNGRTVIRY